MEGTCKNCTRRFFVPGSGTSEVACPSCGGQMEVDTPGGVNSDGDLRNMVDPGSGQDMGGNPLTEGVLAYGEGAKPWGKRDESFASVKHAATGQATPSLPAGIHNGTMASLGFVGATINGMSPGNDLYTWTVQEWLPAAKAGDQQPVTVEVANEHPAYLAAAIAIVNNSSACMGKKVPVTEFETLIKGIQSGEIPPPQKTSKTAADFDLGGWGFLDDDEENTEPTDKFIVDGQGSVYSLPEPTHHEQIAEKSGLDMSTFPQGLSLGLLNSDGSTEWYQHQTSLQPTQLAEALENHFQKSVTIDPDLKPSSSDERFNVRDTGNPNRSEMEVLNGPPIPRTRPSLDRNEGLVRGGGLNQEIHFPYEHLAMEKEAILPALVVPAAIAAGRVAAPLIAKKLAPKLMKPAMNAGKGIASKALKGLGIHSLVKGVGGALGIGGGGGGGGGQAAAPAPIQAPSLQQITHVISDVETPTSLPALHENDGDTLQFDDGSNDNNNLEHPNIDESGVGSLTPATALLDELLPHVLDHYIEDKAGSDDPLMRALDEALEREFPGYKDEDDGDHKDLEDFFAELVKNHDTKTSAGPFYPGMGNAIPQPQQGMMPNATTPPIGPANVGPIPAENACPNCGAQLNPDGTCAQCISAQQNIPGQQMPSPGLSGNQSMPPNVHAKVSDSQGPYTPKQYKAVAEVLLQMNRAEEIPRMYDAPWEYADILAQVQNKVNEPPPAVEAPAAPATPPGMGDPSMMGMEGAPPGGPPADPSMMTARIAAAVKLFSSDNIAPKCPKCDSHTTEIIPAVDGTASAHCHNCKNAWDVQGVTKSAEVAEHPHDQPILDHSDLDTETPHPDDNNDLTWTTPDGQSLTPGEEYEMHSEEYSIPDIIRIEEVKPNELVYTVTGEYEQLEDISTITPEEVKDQGIKFLPIGGEGAPIEEQTSESTEPTGTSRVPITTSKVNTAAEPPPEASWLLDNTEIEAPAPWENPLPDLTGEDIVKSSLDDERNWLVSDLPKTAGARFSPSEQRAFIDEEGEARNLDRLDIENTHYRTKETSAVIAGRNTIRHAQPDMVDDSHLVFGL